MKKNIGALINDSYFDTGNTALNRVFFLDKSLNFVEYVQYLMYTVFLVQIDALFAAVTSIDENVSSCPVSVMESAVNVSRPR